MLQNLMVLGNMAKLKVRTLFTDEKGAVDIVAIVVLIGIAVLLAVVFKDAISGLIETLLETIKKNAEGAVGVGGAGAGATTE